MASRHHSRPRCNRWTSSTPGVARTNHDSRSGYWHPPQRLRRCQKRVGRPEPWSPSEASSFSLLRALSFKEIASISYLFPPTNFSAVKTLFCDGHHIANERQRLLSYASIDTACCGVTFDNSSLNSTRIGGASVALRGRRPIWAALPPPIELLAEVPIAASLGGIRPIPAQVEGRRRRHRIGCDDGAQCDAGNNGPVVGS